jgi:hypothetical protein
MGKETLQHSRYDLTDIDITAMAGLSMGREFGTFLLLYQEKLARLEPMGGIDGILLVGQ